MEERTFDEFVHYLKQRRVLGYRPPVLLVGAGASFEAGIGTMKQLFEFTGVAGFDEFVEYIRGRSADERYIHLSSFLQTQAPAEVTPGYRALAALLAENYFDLVLSTNFDPLLEDALADARLWRKDYMLLVNGIVRPERLDLILKEPSPRVKIIKLHGDLFHRYMAWTPEEMEAFVDDIRPRLKKVLWGRDIIIVGYSMSDKPIRELVVKAGGPDSTIWYLHFAEVAKALRANPRVRGVVDPLCKFEQLFPALAQALDVEGVADTLPRRRTRAASAAPAPAAVQKRTLDDVMASVVGLAPGADAEGPAICTGFVLSQPRLIVTEGFSGGHLTDTCTVVTTDGRRLPARLVRRDTSHPFGPVFFEAPAELNAPGLALDAAPIHPPLPVRVGVAAGERVGVSSGSVTALDVAMRVAPVGQVSSLASIDSIVASGSAGAPVVDAATLAVRGYIVAGSNERPPSLMYPAQRWARAVPTPARPVMR
ncbi:MAG TPA: SIR2 family protein [Longimicrobium sp.]|nr:SIR2 family protein [Longimicrobium sp.]